jgi:uncharacterized membrane protein YebE (DUF533 family)
MVVKSSQQEINSVENSSLSRAEAFAGVILAAAAADHEITDKEIKCIQVTLSRMRLFEGWSLEQYNAMFNKLTDILNTQEGNTLLEMSIESLPPELYETAFTISTDVVLSDGVVTREERDFISKLQQKLNIGNRLAAKILEVILIKNRG